MLLRIVDDIEKVGQGRRLDTLQTVFLFGILGPLALEYDPCFLEGRCGGSESTKAAKVSSMKYECLAESTVLTNPQSTMMRYLWSVNSWPCSINAQ